MSLRAASSELAKFDVQPPKKTVLGQEKWFEDSAPDNAGGIVDALGSNFPIRAILVANNSGGVLLPGRRVIWDTSSDLGVGLAVGTYAGNDVPGAGIVSHLVTSTGVPDDATFWLITRGPCKVRADGNAFTAGADISAAATGQAKTGSASKIGVARETFADTDPDDFVEAFVEFIL